MACLLLAWSFSFFVLQYLVFLTVAAPPPALSPLVESLVKEVLELWGPFRPSSAPLFTHPTTRVPVLPFARW